MHSTTRSFHTDHRLYALLDTMNTLNNKAQAFYVVSTPNIYFFFSQRMINEEWPFEKYPHKHLFIPTSLNSLFFFSYKIDLHNFYVGYSNKPNVQQISKRQRQQLLQKKNSVWFCTNIKVIQVPEKKYMKKFNDDQTLLFVTFPLVLSRFFHFLSSIVSATYS